MIEVELPDGRVVEFPDGTSREEMARAMRTLAPAKPLASTAPQEASGLFRQLGLTGRAAVKGLVGLPGMLSDATIRPALNLGLGAMGSEKRFPPSQVATDRLLSSAGVPEPANATERVSGDIASAMTGVGGAAKAGKAVGGWLEQALASRLGTQTTSAGAGAGAASLTNEAGGGSVAQFLASLIGGSAPTGARAITAPVSTAASRLTEPWRNLEASKSRALGNLVGERRQSVLDALKGAPGEVVPGSKPTAAQRAVPAGSTELSAAERLLKRKYDPSGYRDIEVGQQKARDTWAGYPLTPEGQAVPFDTARMRANERMASQGSTAARESLGAAFRPLEPPGMLNRGVMLARAVLERTEGKATEKVLSALTQDMKDPEAIARLLAAYRANPKLFEQLKGTGLPLSAAGLQVLPQIEGD